MCASRHLCQGGDHAPPNPGSANSTGSPYALIALGVGLVALGVVMIVWSVVPAEAAGNNSSSGGGGGDDSTDLNTKEKTSSVAFVLVGVGVAMLLLAICLSLRNRRLEQHRQIQGAASRYRVPGEQGDTEMDPLPSYNVPSYEEAVGSGQYPVRQSNLRNSTSQLPSYEDLLQAVENEREEPGANAGQDSPQSSPTPPAATNQPAAVNQPAPEAHPAPEAQPTPEPQPAPPVRHGSRSSRIFRPLRVRRIKSEKLHLRDFRLNIRNPAQTGLVNIEPLTPPPQYEDKMPEL